MIPCCARHGTLVSAAMVPVASRTRTRPDVPHRRRLVRFVTGSPLRSPRPICFGNPFGLSRYSPSRLSRCYRQQISRVGARCEREHHCVQGRVAGSRTPGAGLRPRGKRSERRLTYGPRSNAAVRPETLYICWPQQELAVADIVNVID